MIRPRAIPVPAPCFPCRAILVSAVVVQALSSVWTDQAVAQATASAGDHPAAPAAVTGVVIRVIDGDTIVVEGMGRVRLLGVDTPESVDPRREVQPFGREAASYTRARLQGRRVRLEFEQDRTDRYGRTLAYVFLPDGTLFNESLLYDGYAYTYTAHPFARMEAFLEAQRSARAAGRGLWRLPRAVGSTDETIHPSSPAAPPDNTAASESPLDDSRLRSSVKAERDPSYPDVCIPPPPPDLQCRHVPHRRFRVIEADPHRFDGDGDGIGCER